MELEEKRKPLNNARRLLPAGMERNASFNHPVRQAGAGGWSWSGVREKHYYLAGGWSWSGVRGNYCSAGGLPTSRTR